MLKICYDEEYMGPGYIVADEEKGSFFKIYLSSNEGLYYNFVAHDQNVDTGDEPDSLRKIIFGVKKEDPLFETVEILFQQISDGQIQSVFRESHLNNSFSVNCKGLFAITEGRKHYQEGEIVFKKDIFTDGDNCHIAAGDCVLCEKWCTLSNFYQALATCANCEFKDVAHILGIKIGDGNIVKSKALPEFK